MINDLWYKNAVIYCLSVGTYMDSDGDGTGDFRGLMRRLDYLHGLGVTAIWLMPFQTSPCRDDGYDITDYYNVDPRYGTLGDFIEFTHGAKQRGIRVLIDLVVNHTSDQHPWFKQARSDPNSKYRNWYVWSKKKPPLANKGMVFPGVQKSTWTYDREAKAWYFHRFYDFQPDLNTSNPEVQDEILKIMGFWIQSGVSGFRMDAVPFIISTKGPNVRKPKEQFDMLRVFREFLQWRQGDSIVLAEANVLPETDMDYFGEDGDRMHMMFNFQVNQNLFYALAAADTRPLIKALKATKPRPATAHSTTVARTWATRSPKGRSRAVCCAAIGTTGASISAPAAASPVAGTMYPSSRWTCAASRPPRSPPLGSCTGPVGRAVRRAARLPRRSRRAWVRPPR